MGSLWRKTFVYAVISLEKTRRYANFSCIDYANKWKYNYCQDKFEPGLIYSGQFSSVTQLSPTLCNPMDCSTPGLPVHHQLPEFTQTHVHWVGDAIQPSHPLSSPSPPAFNLSQHQGLFKWVSSLPKYWSFSFSISPSNEYSGLISFRIHWFDLHAVQNIY